MDPNKAAPETPEGESQPTTLEDELRAAFAAAEATDEVPEEDVTEPPADDDEGDDSDAPETEDDSEEEPEPDEDSDTPDEEDGDEPGEAITPPSHWSEGDKEVFNSAPADIQKWMLRRHKEMEADYTRKTTEIAPLRKALEPFRGEMERLGMNEAQAMQHITGAAQQLWGYQQQLQQNPKAVIQAIAQAYGVDLGGAAKPDDGQYVDPEIRRLSEQVTNLVTERQQERQLTAQQQQQEVNRTLAAFAENHPHFDSLKVTMGVLMEAAYRQGKQMTLEQAYEDAQWSHPEIREKILAEKQAEKERKAREERKAKAKQARAAGRSLSTKQTPAPDAAAPTSLADDLRSELRRQMKQ